MSIFLTLPMVLDRCLPTAADTDSEPNKKDSVKHLVPSPADLLPEIYHCRLKGSSYDFFVQVEDDQDGRPIPIFMTTLSRDSNGGYEFDHFFTVQAFRHLLEGRIELMQAQGGEPRRFHPARAVFAPDAFTGPEDVGSERFAIFMDQVRSGLALMHVEEGRCVKNGGSERIIGMDKRARNELLLLFDVLSPRQVVVQIGDGDGFVLLGDQAEQLLVELHSQIKAQTSLTQ